MAFKVMRGFKTYGMAVGTFAFENWEVSSCLNIGGRWSSSLLTTSDLNELRFHLDC
jgi:hypothetical protein